MTRTKTFWMGDQIMARPLPVHEKHSGFEQATPGVRAVDIWREYSALVVWKWKTLWSACTIAWSMLRRFSQYLIPP